MGNPDTDSDSECFESAEESFDEADEEKSTKEKLRKCENEVVELVPNHDNVESPQVEKDIPGNLSYRKRPERVKRSLSNTAKPIPKSSSNETIFKAEKLMPDAFLQDITNNLSKNINKSINTLQQKSSNVKDLIFSSLPVSSVNESERFTYDDNTVTILSNESVLPITAQNSETNEFSNLVKSNEEHVKKQEVCSIEPKTATITDVSTVDKASANSDEGPPVDKKENNLDMNGAEGSCSENPMFNDKLTNCIAEEENKVGINLGDDIDKVLEEIREESIKIPSENKNLEQFDETSYAEPFCEQEKTNSSETTHTKSDTDNKEPEVSSLMSTKLEEMKVECQKHPSIENISEFTYETLESNENVNNLEHVENIEESKNIEECQKIESDINNLRVPESQLNQECNVQELKSALEKIVNLKESNSSSNDKENQHSTENFSNLEKTDDVNPISSNDGWDDFDFSDDEVENIGTSEPITGKMNLIEKVPEKSNVVMEGKPQNSKKEIADRKTETKVANFAPTTKNLSKESHNMTKQQPAEAEPDDNWDWDNWDESPSDQKEKVENPSKLKSSQAHESTSDISKWSGWDTFAQKPQERQGNWGLGSWGVDLLLNKATAVTQGISNVLEAGLGAPDPETLARMEKMEKEKLQEVEPEQEFIEEIPKKNSLTNVNLFPVAGITSLVAGVTSKIVEHSKIQEIGSKVITGGLDTLETFGKKTMEVLQEGDPGLKNKRALLLGNNKPVLSQVLKEAREKADREMKKVEEKEFAKKCHFETLFDDFQGMIHLEALEMLSRQCELKLEQIRSGMNSEEQEDLNGILEEVEQLCALDEFDSDLKASVVDFKTALLLAVEPLKNEISVHKIVQIHEGVSKWLGMSSETKPSLAVVHQKLVSTVAELAAATVHQFHKSGELLSVKECRKTVEEVDALSRLTNILCSEINRLCDKFMLLSHSSSANNGNENLNSFSEKVTATMKNSTSYIRQAFDLLIPVIQLGAAV